MTRIPLIVCGILTGLVVGLAFADDTYDRVVPTEAMLEMLERVGQ